VVDEAEREARLALSCVVEPGNLRIGPIVAHRGAVDVWESLRRSGADNAWARRARALDLRPVRLLAQRHGLRFIVPGTAEWPARLADLATAETVQDAGGEPLGLWVKGNAQLDALASSSVAVVGSRASSAYGDRVAADLGAGLAASGLTVVSGGAFGIDAAAHRGALSEGGPSVAVLACGLDAAYPRAHEGLLAAIAESGLLVSEAPPGERPTRRRFLPRNRLIAALTVGTVIVEAAVRSGARNTVTWAGACRRVVMAVPGPVTSVTSWTPHRLIREGEAALVTSVEDVRELVRPAGECLTGRPRQERLLDTLAPRLQAVYEALPSRGTRAAGDLALRAGLAVPACLGALQELAEAGLARASDDGGWRLGDVQDRPLPPSADEERGGGDR